MNHDKIYTERIEIKVSKKQRQLLDKKCQKEGLTLNQYIRDAIDLSMEEA